MKNININDYLKSQKTEYDKVLELLSKMESNKEKFITYKSVAYNKRNVVGLLSRIESRMEGAVNFNKNINTKKWRDVHRILLEKFSEKEFDYHLEVDAIHNLTQSIKSTEKVVKEQFNVLPQDAINGLKNSINKMIQTVNYLKKENKKIWIENRFFELASIIEFEDNGKIYPLNLESVEDIHPLDIVKNGSIDLNVLKDYGHHRNVFIDRFKDIKMEALKETLLEDELQREEA
jgi:hypothetical protein